MSVTIHMSGDAWPVAFYLNAVIRLLFIAQLILTFQAKDINESVTFLSQDPRKDGTEAIRRGDTFDSKEKTLEPPTSAPGMPPRCKQVF